MATNTTLMTSGIDLEKIVSSCKKCSKLVQKGKNIICHTQLRTTNVKNRKGPYGYIINTSTDPSVFGHWFNLNISSKNDAFFCDGLDYVKKLPEVMNNVYYFCQKNGLNLKMMSIRCQENKSSSCGFVSLYFLAKFSTLPIQRFIKLPNLFKKNSIKTNELSVLRYVKFHFKLNP